jgi:hypothetical protein
MRRALIIERNAAIVGVDADVPSTGIVLPLYTTCVVCDVCCKIVCFRMHKLFVVDMRAMLHTSKPAPMTETSGNARPLTSNNDVDTLFVLKNCANAFAWYVGWVNNLLNPPYDREKAREKTKIMIDTKHITHIQMRM